MSSGTRYLPVEPETPPPEPGPEPRPLLALLVLGAAALALIVALVFGILGFVAFLRSEDTPRVSPNPSAYPSFPPFPSSSAAPTPFPSFSAQPTEPPPEPPIATDAQMQSMVVPLVFVPETDGEDPSRYMGTGGTDNRNYMNHEARGSFFTYNNKVYMATSAHARNNLRQNYRRLPEFRSYNAEVLSFIDHGTIELALNYSRPLSAMTDCWGWSFAEPMVPIDGGQHMHMNKRHPNEPFEQANLTSVADYVHDKYRQHMHHYPIIGSNRDTVIAHFSQPKDLTAVEFVIPDQHDAEREWSDQKVYSVQELHIVDIGAEDELWYGKIVEFNYGKIVRILEIKPYPGDPYNTTQRVIRVDTVDIFGPGDKALRHEFWVHHVPTTVATAYTTHEAPGDLVVTDLTPLYSHSTPQVMNSYYDLGASINYTYNTWPYQGAHNLHVDQTGGRLFVAGLSGIEGGYVFDLKQDPHNLVLQARVLPPINQRGRRYSHDFATVWYNRTEQMELLGIPEALANDMLCLGLSSDESHYTLANYTVLQGDVVLEDEGLVFDVHVFRRGLGYSHSAGFTTDKRFALFSDESQPDDSAYNGRIPVARIHWKNGTLRMIDQQPIITGWNVNLHQFYLHSNRRVRPQFIDDCGSPPAGPYNPAVPITACNYDPNEFFASQPFEDYMFLAHYGAGTVVLSLHYRQGYNLSSTGAWENPFEVRVVGEVGSGHYANYKFAGEWNVYKFGNFEFPASELVFGSNGIDSWRLSRLSPNLHDNSGVRKSYTDKTHDDFILLSSRSVPTLAKKNVGFSTGVWSMGVDAAVETTGASGSSVPVLGDSTVVIITHLSPTGDYCQSVGSDVGADSVADVAFYEISSTPECTPYAPELAPIGSSLDELYAWVGERLVRVDNSRIISEHIVSEMLFDIRLTLNDSSSQSTINEHLRRSEIITSALPVHRGESGSPLMDAQGRLVGVLRDVWQTSPGFVDVRDFAHALSVAELPPSIESKYTGYWSLWEARLNNITEDPLDKIAVLAINPRTQRFYTCISTSGTAYIFGSLEFSGDSIDAESGEAKYLKAPPNSINFQLVEMDEVIYSTAIGSLSPIIFDLGIVQCGGCLLPVSGSVGNLLPYEELFGVYAAGGPRIVFLGSHGTREIDAVVYNMISFHVVPHGNDVPGQPQLGGLYTDSPIPSGIYHPPQGGDVLTGAESGTVLTVAPGYVQTSVVCPESLIPSNDIAPSFRDVPGEPSKGIAWWPLRTELSTDFSTVSRLTSAQWWLSNYTLPFEWTGLSGSAQVLKTGMLGVGLNKDVDKWLLVEYSYQSIEERYAPANRMGFGAILALAKPDFSDVYPVNSDTYFGVMNRFEVHSDIAVFYVNFFGGSAGWIERKVLPKLSGNQLGLD